MKPKVDRDVCTGCGVCEAVCPSDVFLVKQSKSRVVNFEECIECEACIENCPEGAIVMEA